MRVDYRDVEEMKEELMEMLEAADAMEAAKECDDAWELREIFDQDLYLHEHVDGMINIYNHELRLWAVHYWEWVEEAMQEGLASDSDYHQAIQAGQYVYYNAAAYEAIEEIFDNINKEEAA